MPGRPSCRKFLEVTTAVLVIVLSLAGVVPTVQAAGGPAALSYHEPATPDGTVTVLRGDGNLVGTLDDSADLRRARAAGSVRPTPHLVAGDLLVLQFRSARVTETFAGIGGTDTTDRFFRMLDATDVNLSVVRTDTFVHQPAHELALDRRNVAVLHDSGNATFALLVDTGRVTLVERDDGDPIRRLPGDLGFEAIVEIPTIDGDRRVLVGGSEFVPPSVTIRSPDSDVHLRNRPATIRRHKTDSLTVDATTMLLPGSMLSVAAVAPDGSVLAERRVQTREPPGLSDRFGHSVFVTNLSVGPLDADEEFDLVISWNRPIDERRVVVGDPPGMWNTTAELVTDGEHEGQVRVQSTLELPADGFLLVSVDGEPVTKPVPGDSRVRTTMYVDRRAVDRDDGDVVVSAIWDRDGDGIYDESDQLIDTSVDFDANRHLDKLVLNVPVEGWPGGTSTTSPTPSSPTTPATTSTTPGFGVLVAVVGVLSAVLLWAWRHWDSIQI